MLLRDGRIPASDKRSNEAAMKYLLLGAFSSGFLVYGFSVMYGLARFDASSARSPPPSLRAPPGTRWSSWRWRRPRSDLLFKISAVPFHMWAPDAYEGAPTTVTAYLSVASKAASIAFLLRIFLGPLARRARPGSRMLIGGRGAHADASATWRRSIRPISSGCWPTARFRTRVTCCSA